MENTNETLETRIARCKRLLENPKITPIVKERIKDTLKELEKERVKQ